MKKINIRGLIESKMREVKHECLRNFNKANFMFEGNKSKIREYLNSVTIDLCDRTHMGMVWVNSGCPETTEAFTAIYELSLSKNPPMNDFDEFITDYAKIKYTKFLLSKYHNSNTIYPDYSKSKLIDLFKRTSEYNTVITLLGNADYIDRHKMKIKKMKKTELVDLIILLEEKHYFIDEFSPTYTNVPQIIENTFGETVASKTYYNAKTGSPNIPPLKHLPISK